MIAKVRIAPLERWCSWVKSDALPNDSLLPGLEIEIMTHTMISDMAFDGCVGKRWMATLESQNKIDEILFGHAQGQKAFWCEHMLELD